MSISATFAHALVALSSADVTLAYARSKHGTGCVFNLLCEKRDFNGVVLVTLQDDELALNLVPFKAQAASIFITMTGGRHIC